MELENMLALVWVCIERRKQAEVLQPDKTSEASKATQGEKVWQTAEELKSDRELLERLDMNWLENRRAVQLVQHMVDMEEKDCPCEELLEKDWELLQKTYYLSMERMQTPPVVKDYYYKKFAEKI